MTERNNEIAHFTKAKTPIVSSTNKLTNSYDNMTKTDGEKGMLCPPFLFC